MFAAFAALDLVLVVTTDALRNAAGQIEGAAILIRCLPDLILVLLCSSIGMQLRNDSRLTVWAVLISAAVFLLLGVLSLVPWIGMFFVMLTPVSVLYFAAILWSPRGVMVAVGISLVFILVNAAISAYAVRRLAS
jgi:hypothetical protein